MSHFVRASKYRHVYVESPKVCVCVHGEREMSSHHDGLSFSAFSREEKGTPGIQRTQKHTRRAEICSSLFTQGFDTFGCSVFGTITTCIYVEENQLPRASGI